MSEWVYLNGELIDRQRAMISVSNPAFLYGVGLFETLRAYGGRPFRLDRHIERLRTSADKLTMDVADAIDKIASAVEQVLETNHLTDARIRITVTPTGDADENGVPTLLVAAQQTIGYPEELYRKGMSVLVCTDYRQSAMEPLAGHKSTCYFGRLRVLQTAQKRQCSEALWFNPASQLAEGCISNVFLVKAGALRTPPLETPVLPGIVRADVIELAGQAKIPVEQTPCTIHDLLDADEVFLTNSIMEIMPVSRVELRPIAAEKPGPITTQLADAYRRLVCEECPA